MECAWARGDLINELETTKEVGDAFRKSPVQLEELMPAPLVGGSTHQGLKEVSEPPEVFVAQGKVGKHCRTLGFQLLRNVRETLIKIKLWLEGKDQIP